MKKIIACILIFLTLLGPAYSDPIEYEYEPYEREAFPIWSLELRRAETIFFGSLVLTFPLAMGIYSLASNLGMPTPSEDYQRVLQQALIAGGLSLVIAGTDWIIGKVSGD